jgi:hypothetical protein
VQATEIEHTFEGLNGASVELDPSGKEGTELSQVRTSEPDSAVLTLSLCN